MHRKLCWNPQMDLFSPLVMILRTLHSVAFEIVHAWRIITLAKRCNDLPF